MEKAEYLGHVVGSSYHFRHLSWGLVGLIFKSVPNMMQISINNKLLGKCLPTGMADLPKPESHVYNQLY